jgi:hypothetical protein
MTQGDSRDHKPAKSVSEPGSDIRQNLGLLDALMALLDALGLLESDGQRAKQPAASGKN